MSVDEKKEIIAEILELELDEVTEETVLEELETWDSVAVLSVISVMDSKFGRSVHANDVAKCMTIEDLIAFMN